MNASEMINNATKDIIKERLSLCTDPQIAFFNRIFKSVDELPEDKLKSALELIERTIRKNEET